MRAVLHAESITRLLKMRAVAQDRRARSSQDLEATIVSDWGYTAGHVPVIHPAAVETCCPETLIHGLLLE